MIQLCPQRVEAAIQLRLRRKAVERTMSFFSAPRSTSKSACACAGVS
jgi:hypothetical protein